MKSDLINLLDHQWTCDKKIDHSIWQNIYNNFPEFRYQGTGYRAVIICDPKKCSYDHNKNLYPGKAWTSDMEGLKNFLYNTYLDDEDYDKSDKVIVIEGKVYGVDLVKIITYLKTQKGYSVPMAAINEKEVVSLSCKVLKESNFILSDLMPH